MKRQKKRDFVHKCFPLLAWKTCANCGQEFVREYGWKAEIKRPGWGYHYPYAVKYLCSECAPSIAEAEKMFFEVERIPEKPPYISKPPPPKKYVT